MASRYSLTAEMPPTRKSIRRSQRITTDATLFNQAIPERHTDKIQLNNLHQGIDHIPNMASATDLPATDERGYKKLQGKDRWALTPNPLLEDGKNDEGRKRSDRLAYLEGIRGILGLQTLLWIFFRFFAPAIVTEVDVDGTQPADFVGSSPEWMSVLRKALSPLFFDGNLQVTMFIILSGRTVLHTFIERRQAVALSGPAFRRPFRLLLPVLAALTIVSIVNVAGGFKYAIKMADNLNNTFARPAPIWDSAIEFFNTLVVYFFSPIAYKNSRAATFIPAAGTMWFVTIVFQQVYVLIIIAWVLPYTLLKYKNFGLPLFILTTAWVGRWSWYTITGLAIAEYSVVYLPILPPSGIPLDRNGRRHMPAWLVPALMSLTGVVLKYLWAAVWPGSYNNEYVAHVNAHTGKLNWNFEAQNIAYPRYDDWLLATGLLMLVELSPSVQRELSAKPLVYMGRWSFSIVLIAGTVMQSLGSYLYDHFTSTLGWTSEAAITAALFCIVIPASLVVVEVFSRVVDDSALWFSHFMFCFMRT
ncbi:hypothetical protein ACQY0O_004965 [Thecaphora frezii]